MTPTPNFDRVARLYRFCEYLALGRLLERTRTHFLPQLADRRHAYILGDGDGRFLAALLHHNQQLHATAIDTSAAMLQLLTQRCAFASNRLQTIHASLRDTTPAPTTDLITTHFVLDCFTQTEVNALAHHLAASTSSGTLWLLSDFGLPTHPTAKLFARAYIRALYFAFRILTGLRVTQLPNPQAALTAAGFQLLARHQRLQGFVYTELWQRS